MGIPFLTKPLDIYKESYILAIKEFHCEGTNLKYDISELNKNFNKFLFNINELILNPKLELGKVKESIYWLIDNEEFIGRISIRHNLSPYLQKYDGNIGFEIRPSKRKMGYGYILLELGIREVRNIGLDNIVIMCKDINKASIKIIEKNNGILIEKYFLKIDGEDIYVRKYTIAIK